MKALLIQMLLRQLLDPTTRATLERLVITVLDMDMSGEAKRQYVLRELNTAGAELTSWAVNLALELLVAKTKI
ncbi:MAG: hypothetical protein KDK05_16880 [Candidatus Competibacteraceae bacterium]|nr:hypothetical protein [Candidatus Competibacteraceae bacterium]